MEGHLRTCTIDGLNIGNNWFNWNDRLIIFHNKEEPDKNLSNVHVLMHSPYPDHETINGEIQPIPNQKQGDALETIVKFLVCYHLTNDFPMPKIIAGTWTSTNLESFHSIDQIKTSGFIHNIKSTIQLLAENDVCNGLNATRTLFEKIMRITEKNREPLTIAMIFYYNSKHSEQIYSSFLDLVAVLETLFTENDGEVRYKFSLRTSIFMESDPEKRYALFEKLKKIYKDRSELVHGDDITLNPYTKYHQHVSFLTPLVFETLHKYIELSSSLTKKEIIKQIDKITLGTNGF